MRIAVFGALMLLTMPVSAHDFWTNNESVDPRTKVKCCGENDCRALADDQVSRVDGGYAVFDHVGAPDIVPDSRVMPAPDGHYWVCRWGGELRCFFAPVNF